MLYKHKVVFDLLLSLFGSFLLLCVQTVSSRIKDRLIESHDFLESVPPTFNITSVSSTFWCFSCPLVSEVSKTFFEDIVPMTEVLRRNAFKVVWALVLLVIGKFAS